MGSYTRRLQAPTKERTADWIPEDGELFRDSAGNFYMGDNVTASNALTAIGGGGGVTGLKRYMSLLTLLQSQGPPPAMPVKVWLKVAGVWKLCTVHIKVSSVWKVATPKLKVSGVWQ